MLTEDQKGYNLYFPLHMEIKTVKDSGIKDDCNPNNVGNTCGFRPNWLSFQVFLIMVDKTGKKACIINHRQNCLKPTVAGVTSDVLHIRHLYNGATQVN